MRVLYAVSCACSCGVPPVAGAWPVAVVALGSAPPPTGALQRGFDIRLHGLRHLTEIALHVIDVARPPIVRRQGQRFVALVALRASWHSSRYRPRTFCLTSKGSVDAHLFAGPRHELHESLRPFGRDGFGVKVRFAAAIMAGIAPCAPGDSACAASSMARWCTLVVVRRLAGVWLELVSSAVRLARLAPSVPLTSPSVSPAPILSRAASRACSVLSFLTFCASSEHRFDLVNSSRSRPVRPPLPGPCPDPSAAA